VSELQAPFPWFGGKSRVAGIVWERFGDVPNYVEPFAGSLAVLLGRQTPPHTETVNDLDCHVANFWRALQAAPDEVAKHADWPVNEADLHPRHCYLLNLKPSLAERVMGDPNYYDAKAAGWWVWGICCWIGSGWCSGVGPWQTVEVDGVRQLVHLGDAGQGVNRKLVHLGDAGRGVNRKLVHLGDMLQELADRLRSVRVCCGDWLRVMGPSVTFRHGMTGVMLDPPYADTADRCSNLYTEDSLSVAHQVRDWCIENGDNPLLRIALCGYEGEHVMPESWECVAWKATGGYNSEKSGNSAKERIWFSPACVRPAKQRGLFDLMEVEP